MVASVAGQGLVLTVYALIGSILDKIIKTRSKLIKKNTKELNSSIEAYKSQRTGENLKQLNESDKRLKELRSFPTFFSYGILLTFMFYSFSSLFAIAWFGDNLLSYEFLLMLFFILATAVFLGVGIYTIQEVYRTMIHEWKVLEEEKKEAEETTSEELGKLRKDIEELKQKEDMRVS